MALNLTAIPALRAALLDAVEEAAGETILAKADGYIPVDQAVAQRSGRVVRDGERIVVTFGRDDDGSANHAPSNTYIEILHEDMEMRHPHGGQAKFLSRAADESVAGFLGDVVRKVKV
jgi:hypothetical protein